MASVIKSVTFDAADALALTRLHFGLRAPGPAAAEVSRLTRLRATVTREHASHRDKSPKVTSSA